MKTNRILACAGLVIITLALAALLEPIASLTTSPAEFSTSGSSNSLGMASEYLPNFNDDGDAWVTTADDMIIIYQGSNGTYPGTTINIPSRTGTWGIYGFDVTCGDYNDDGYGDVIVTDPYWDDPSSTVDVGILICYFSDDNPIDENTDPDYVEGVTANGHGGFSIDTGNFDGDDYDDIIVGEPGYSSNNGQVHIFLGCSNPASWGSISSGSSDWSVAGSAGNGDWGICVRSLEDGDDDGYDDFTISHSDTSGTSTHYSNEIEVYYGDSDIPNLSTTPSLNIIPNNMPSGTETYFGMDVDAGDLDGDGYNDIMSMDKVYISSGMAKSEFWILIFYGSSSGYSTASYYFYRTHVEAINYDVSSFKYEITNQGNDDGDSYDDLAYALSYYGPPSGMMGPPFSNYNYGVEGHHGESTLSWSSSDWVIGGTPGITRGIFHGKSLNGVYEQNGDSKDDLIVGEYGASSIELYEGN